MKNSEKFPIEFYYLYMQKVLGAGSNKVRDVFEKCTAEEFYSLSKTQMEEFEIFSPAEIKRKSSIKDSDILNIIKYCKEHKIRIIYPESEEYLPVLDYIECPPLVLFAKGKPLNGEIPAIGIVGTRKSSEFGNKAAFSLAARLSLSGFVIVSGGALGIDNFAHIGATATGGKSVLVMGCGLDADYLKCQDNIRKRVMENGTLLSEFPPKTPAARYTFPIRNRLIAALSCGVAVIEAGEKSGALITATYAMEQGKDVFAVPGSITNGRSAGTNKLLQDGAIPLVKVEDIIGIYTGRFEDKISLNNKLDANIRAVLKKELELLKKPKTVLKNKDTDIEKDTQKNSEISNKPPKPPYELKTSDKNIVEKEKTDNKKEVKSKNPLGERFSPENVTPNAEKIYTSFENETETADKLSEKSGITGAEFLVAVTELELLGYIKAVPVGQYMILK